MIFFDIDFEVFYEDEVIAREKIEYSECIVELVFFRFVLRFRFFSVVFF